MVAPKKSTNLGSASLVVAALGLLILMRDSIHIAGALYVLAIVLGVLNWRSTAAKLGILAGLFGIGRIVYFFYFHPEVLRDYFGA